jgi:hypothetical protein
MLLPTMLDISAPTPASGAKTIAGKAGIKAKAVKNYEAYGMLGHYDHIALASVMFFHQPCSALAGKHPHTRRAAVQAGDAQGAVLAGGRRNSLTQGDRCEILFLIFSQALRTHDETHSV